MGDGLLLPAAEREDAPREPDDIHLPAFEDRLRMVASHIASGRGTNRTFDSYFENDDGDALVVALARRANARPNSKLAANLYRYLCRESVT